MKDDCDRQKAREIFGIPEDLTIIEVIAVGWPGDIMDLPEVIREQEHPSAADGRAGVAGVKLRKIVGR